MNNDNISSVCRIESTNKQTLRRKIWEQWRSVMQTGNVITPALIKGCNDINSGNIHLGDGHDPLIVNDLLIVGDKVLITQSGFLLSLNDVKKNLSESIDNEQYSENGIYCFDAWFVKVVQ